MVNFSLGIRQIIMVIDYNVVNLKMDPVMLLKKKNYFFPINIPVE